MNGAAVERDRAQRAGTERATVKAARERRTPLEERLVVGGNHP